MGDVMGLDYGAVLDVIKLYSDDVKGSFERVLECFRIEQEFNK